MNRRKFLTRLLKGSAGIVVTSVVGDTILDALVPLPKSGIKVQASSLHGVLNLKGHQHLGAGYIYAPYIPIMETPITLDGTKMTGLMSRYAKKVVNKDYYGMIKFNG